MVNHIPKMTANLALINTHVGARGGVTSTAVASTNVEPSPLKLIIQPSNRSNPCAIQNPNNVLLNDLMADRGAAQSVSMDDIAIEFDNVSQDDDLFNNPPASRMLNTDGNCETTTGAFSGNNHASDRQNTVANEAARGAPASATVGAMDTSAIFQRIFNKDKPVVLFDPEKRAGNRDYRVYNSQGITQIRPKEDEHWFGCASMDIVPAAIYNKVSAWVPIIIDETLEVLVGICK